MAPGIEMEQLSNLQECRHTEPGAETFGRMTSCKNIQDTNYQVTVDKLAQTFNHVQQF